MREIFKCVKLFGFCLYLLFKVKFENEVALKRVDGIVSFFWNSLRGLFVF